MKTNCQKLPAMPKFKKICTHEEQHAPENMQAMQPNKITELQIRIEGSFHIPNQYLIPLYLHDQGDSLLENPGKIVEDKLMAHLPY